MGKNCRFIVFVYVFVLYVFLLFSLLASNVLGCRVFAVRLSTQERMFFGISMQFRLFCECLLYWKLEYVKHHQQQLKTKIKTHFMDCYTMKWTEKKILIATMVWDSLNSCFGICVSLRFCFLLIFFLFLLVLFFNILCRIRDTSIIGETTI